MNDKIVVNVVGGVVQAIWSDNPDIKVHLFDYDVFDHERKNESGQTKEQQENLEEKLIKNMSEIYQRLKMKDKKLYYLDTVNFGIRSQKEDDLFNLNSSVLSDETLKKVLDDINKNLNKTNKELM